MEEVEPRQIGQYPITKSLYVNATSRFYQSTQRKKELLIQKFTIPLVTSEAKEAFLARTQQLKRLKSNNITNILDANFEGNYPYLVMDYVVGETLYEHISPGRRLAPDEAKRLLTPSATALHYAHMRKIIHGNLHPGNILLTATHTVILTNFSLPELDDTSLAIPYMAPEQLHGEPGYASDQYALAAMAYEWLCGRRPYKAASREALREEQAQTSIPPLRTLNDAISPTIEKVILHALAFEPEKRYQHIQAFADDYLNALMGLPIKGPSIAQPSTSRTSPPPKQEYAMATSTTTTVETKNEQPQSLLTQDVPTLPTTFPSSPSPITAPVATMTLPSASTTQPVPHLSSDLQVKVAKDLCQGGILSQRLPGYEERAAQIEMAMLVSRSIQHAIPTIIEAGTGTGKSLAYLVPIVRSGKVAIVSTANKALQEQLFYKDIPFVQKHIKRFEAALVKGVNNYLCLDRLENERVGMQFFTKNREFQRLLDVVNDPETTFTGDFETLGFQLPHDIRGRVATDSDQCAWSKCSSFSDCYVRQMREQAERAQVIVVNHTLLLLDAAMGGFLLPDRDVIILDEAHHLEEEATRSFTVTIHPNQIQTLLAIRMLKDHSQLTLQDEAVKTAQHMWARLEQVVDLGYKGRVNLEQPLEEGTRLATVVADLADSLRKQRPKDLPEKEGQLYDKLLKRTQNLAEDIRTVFSVSQPDKFVYYVERIDSARGGFPLQVSAAPLEVTSWLKEKLFDKCNVICTSATLATVSMGPANQQKKDANFAYFCRRMGLDQLEPTDLVERVLPLAFDYEHNALLYLPRDLPLPTFGDNANDYMKSIAREMYKLVKLSRGRAFLLFSSRRMMDRAYELMSPHLEFPLLKQGDMSRMELTKRFRSEEGAVLFGLKSFWEGVDIAGDALSLVVIDKLPFDPPDDPVHEARIAQMKAAGENWFGTYVLPQAVLRLKQGLGRLLRTRQDRGVMAILDVRLHTKGYGKLVLNALPPAARTSSLRDVEQFFSK